MAEYFRALKYPLLVWFLLDTPATLLTAWVPGAAIIQDSFTGLAAWTMTLGAAAAYKMIQFKGNWFHAMTAGVITGAWCAFLAITETGIVSTPLITIMTPTGLTAFGGSLMSTVPFGFALLIMSVIGGVIGTGFALTRRPS